MPKTEFNISHRPCAFQAVTVSWQLDHLLLWPGEKRLILWQAVLFQIFQNAGCARFSHNRSQFICLFLATLPTNLPPRGTQEMV